MAEVGRLLGRPIPLVWTPPLSGIGAIEVYPAATLSALGLPNLGYKQPDQRKVREAILQGLVEHILLPGDPEPLFASADTLDAVVCLVAALDFLFSRAAAPPEFVAARKEGWIWVRPSSKTSLQP